MPFSAVVCQLKAHATVSEGTPKTICHYVSPFFDKETLFQGKPSAKPNLKSYIYFVYRCDRHYKDTSRPVSHQEGSYQDGEPSKRMATHGAELAQFSHLLLVFDPGFLANLLNPMRKERICQHSELRRK